MDLMFTDLFSFSSGEESSPHNTSPLEAERLQVEKSFRSNEGGCRDVSS